MENLKEKVGEGVHLVDFWAEWCGPCRMLTPIVTELKERYEGKAGVHKVNVDDNQELAKELGIRSIPTVIIYKDGQEVDRIAGAKEISLYEEKINAFLN
jgi:thioredoxin 1